MINNKPQFSILDCRVRSISFELNKDFAPRKKAEVTIDIDIGYEYIDEDNILKVIIGVDITGKKFLNITVKQEGVFKFDSKPTPDEHLSKTAEITCASILFPFVRETIADLTRRASLPPLLLDPMNFIEFYEQNHDKGNKPPA